jgi:hypothetical protein
VPPPEPLPELVVPQLVMLALVHWAADCAWLAQLACTAFVVAC